MDVGRAINTGSELVVLTSLECEAIADSSRDSSVIRCLIALSREERERSQAVKSVGLSGGGLGSKSGCRDAASGDGAEDTTDGDGGGC